MGSEINNIKIGGLPMGFLMYQKSPLPPGKKGGQNTPNKLTNMSLNPRVIVYVLIIYFF